MKLGIVSGDRIPASRSKDGLNHWGGAGWVRLAQYIPYLEAAGIEVHAGTLVWNKDHFVVDVSDGDQVFVDVDVVYMQRLMHQGLAEHIKLGRKAGQVIINDLDDWYWGLSTTNNAFQASHPKTNPGENVNHYKSVLSASDLVTVSTPYLADRITSFVRCPIIKVDNYVEVERFTSVIHTDTCQPVVGWVGSTAHRSGDLETLAGVIGPMVRNADIYFQHSGHHDNGPLASEALRLDASDVRVVPATSAENYPSLLTMDVGIAPLKDTPFNHAKSDIKVLEYSAAGIPWVASELPAYENLSKEWGLGRVAEKPKDWIKHLQALRDPDIRKEEGNALREAVKSRDIAIGASEMVRLLNSVAK
jgi:glycosyltransferase involved in cell wall biosynthesis